MPPISPGPSSLPSSSRMASRTPLIGAPDGARLLEPPVGLGDRRRALHPAVRLPDHGAPPLQHPALHLERARRRRMDHRMQARDVVPGADVVGKLQQAVELRRHHVRREHPVAFDQLQRGLGVEARHDHQRVPHVQRPHVIGVAAAVVHGGRHEVRPAERHEVERPAEHRGVVGHLARVARLLRTADALRTSRRARRVHEERTGRAVVGHRRRVRGERIGQRLEPVDRADARAPRPERRGRSPRPARRTGRARPARALPSARGWW